MTLNPLLVAALVALLLAGWAIDRTVSENARQADRIATLEDDASRDGELITLQASALTNSQALQGELNRIGTATRQLEQTLTIQTARLDAGLDELKRNDQATRDYLLAAVPAAVGMRHARPETTDPIAYRQAAAGVRADPVPAAGSRPADR
jgi:hypothetical protein